VRLPNIISPIGETIQGAEIPLLATSCGPNAITTAVVIYHWYITAALVMCVT